VVSKKI